MELKRNALGEVHFTEPKHHPVDGIFSCKVVGEDGEEYGYTVTPYDDVPHGQELHALLSGKYADQVQPATEEEIYDYYAGDILMVRASRLKETDWIANGDVQLENQIEWLQYRQDLRDITDQEGYPREVVWPTIPTRTKSIPLDERVIAAIKPEE